MLKNSFFGSHKTDMILQIN